MCSFVFVPLTGLSNLPQAEAGIVLPFFLHYLTYRRLQRCDAARPHCATCVKYVRLAQWSVPSMTFWQAMAGSAQRTTATRIRVSRLSVIFRVYLSRHPPCSHPTEPQCSYDPVEGLPLAPDADPLDKIRELEEQVGASHPSYSCPHVLIHLSAILTKKLRAQRDSLSPSRPQSPNHLRPPSSHHLHQSPSSGTVTLSPDLEPCGITTPSPWHQTTVDQNALSSPEVPSCQPGHPSDPLSGLIYSGWNSDLPEPDVLDH
jgi:hypothetical protein